MLREEPRVNINQETELRVFIEVDDLPNFTPQAVTAIADDGSEYPMQLTDEAWRFDANRDMTITHLRVDCGEHGERMYEFIGGRLYPMQGGDIIDVTTLEDSANWLRRYIQNGREFTESTLPVATTTSPMGNAR